MNEPAFYLPLSDTVIQGIDFRKKRNQKQFNSSNSRAVYDVLEYCFVNTPRRGFFATLLLLSFILHSVLIVVATQYYLDDMREIQGDSIAQQLVKDSVNEFDPPNRVGLALLASRYATDPAIASIRILDKHNQTLATAGNNKTRQGDIFQRQAIVNEQTVGHVEVILVIPTFGEQIHRLWLPILGALLLHVVLWLGYLLTIRPLRAKMDHTESVTEPVTPTLEANATIPATVASVDGNLSDQIKHQRNSEKAVRPVDAFASHQVYQYTEMPFVASDDVYLAIQFYDPKQLLNTFNPHHVQHYLKLMRLFLKKTISANQKQFKLQLDDIKVMRTLDEFGAILKVKKDNSVAIQALLQIAMVYQFLSKRSFERLRAEGHFALQSCCVISEDMPTQKLTAEQASQAILAYVVEEQTAVHLSDITLQDIQHHYTFAEMTRTDVEVLENVRLLQSVSAELAQVAKSMTDDIIHAKSA